MDEWPHKPRDQPGYKFAGRFRPRCRPSRPELVDKGKVFPTGGGRFDTRVYKVFEALQSLEDQVFRLDHRMSASPYKHSTAHVLHALGILQSPEAHPACRDLRGDDEAARMEEALRRPLRMAEKLGIPFRD